MTVRKLKLRKLRNRALAGASAAALGWAVATAALALPVNPTIFASSPIPGPAATFNPSAGNLTINQNAERVVIDWDSFNIASGETVTFVQPDAQAIAFNRVDPLQFTTINGNLNANGSVWLFSPGGILFGSNAQVNTGSFFAGLGALDDFQANQSVGLSDVSVFVNYGNAENLNTLTVDPGAAIFSNNAGFIVLQGAKMDMNGTVGSSGEQIGYIVAEGGVVDFQPNGGNGWSLVHAHQASDPTGRGQPYFNHGGTTLGDWVVIESAQFTETDFETVINLDGVMTLTGSDASNGDALHVWGGNDTTGDIVNGETTTVVASGQISAVGDVSLDAISIYVSGDVTTDHIFEAFAYGVLEVSGGASIDAGGDVTLHSHGDVADITISGDVYSDAIVDIWSTSAGTMTTVDGTVSAAGQVRVRSGGDVNIGAGAIITGDANGNGPLNGIGVNIVSGAALHTPANTYYLSAGDVLIDDGATISGSGAGPQQEVIVVSNGGDLTMAGEIDGSRVVLRGNGLMQVSGQVYATEDIDVLDWTIAQPNSGGGMLITGDAVISADNRVLLITHNGGLLIEGGALIRSDADGVPTADITGAPAQFDNVIISSSGYLDVEAGVTIDAGDNYATFYSAAADTGPQLADAALVMNGDVTAYAVEMYAYDGSIVIGGDITVSGRIDAYAGEAFVLTSDGTLTSTYLSSGTFDPYFADGEVAGILLHAGDLAVAGEMYSQVIAIRSVNPSNTVLGGDEGVANVGAYELGGEFNLSDAEFQNLNAGTIIIISGIDNSDPNPSPNSSITVQDLTVGAGVDNLVLAASSQDHINIVGTLTPQGPDTQFWVGVVNNDTDFPGLGGAIPGQINIDGAIGTATNPFAGVHLMATDEILMGSSDFIGAAMADEEFDAELDDGHLTVDEGHTFIAADVLTMMTPGRIIQQNTGADGQFAGLLIGEPIQGAELISADPSLDGAVIGGPDGYTIDLSTGPVKVQLYGVLLGQSGQITGSAVADNSWLLSPLVPASVEYTINGCRFSGGGCGKGDIAPTFQTPTDTGMTDLSGIEEEQAAADDPASKDDEDAAEESASEDQDSKLFRALVAPGADRAYEQERIGEPITGSGNEDLWTGHGAGDKP